MTSHPFLRKSGLRLLAGSTLALTAAFCLRLPMPAAAGAAPVTQPAGELSALNGDWPAFHGGGQLRGEAKPPLAQGELKLRWTYKAGGDERAPIEGSAAIVGDTVYIADTRGTLHALNLADAAVKWKYTTPDGFTTTPLVFEGKVMLGDMAGVFHCVSAGPGPWGPTGKGQLLWKFDAGGQPIRASANVSGSGPQAKVVFGTDGADIFCLEAGNGKKVWEQKTGDRVNSAPAVGWGLTFVSGCDAVLRAIDLKDGKEKFATDLPALSPASPALLDDRIVLGTDGGKIVCYSSDGQKQLWLYEQVKNDAMVYSSPALAEGIVVAGARDRQVHALDAATGKRVWAFPTRGEVDSSPAISGGRVFVGSKDKKLYVLDLKTGRNLGEFTAGRGIVASPAVARGVVVIGDTAGNVYCLEASQ